MVVCRAPMPLGRRVWVLPGGRVVLYLRAGETPEAEAEWPLTVAPRLRAPALIRAWVAKESTDPYWFQGKPVEAVRVEAVAAAVCFLAWTYRVDVVAVEGARFRYQPQANST